MITKCGTAMLDVLSEEGLSAVMWGDAYLLDEAFARSGCRSKVTHPLSHYQVVLNALDRDERFDKHYNKVDVFVNNQSRSVRCFSVASERGCDDG